MRHNNLILSFIVSIWMTTALSSQNVSCNSNLNASLNPIGVFNLTPSMLLQGSLSNFDSLWLDINLLDCDDIGLNTITLFGINNSGTQSSCQSIVNLVDLFAPIAIAVNKTVQLDASGQHIIEQVDIDGGSLDNCPNLYFTFSPSVITCGMPNPTAVTMTVTDESGNSASALANIYYEDANPGTLACNSNIGVSFPPTSDYEVQLAEVLDNYAGMCASAVYLTLMVDGADRPNNTLTSADYGKNIVASVHAANNNQCWATIDAYTEACPFPFTVDLINWPSDSLELDVDFCDLASGDFSPESLIQNFGMSPLQVLVSFQPHESCLYPVSTYSDVVINEPNIRKIIRSHTVIEWVNNSVFTFVQIIKVNNSEPFICDFLPWNTPIGDCASGHTDTDIVEWPADITINTSAFLPSQLANNQNVNPNDAQPTLIGDYCWYVTVLYTDEFMMGSNNEVLIQRTWTIAFFSGLIHNYVQNITNTYAPQNNFCAFRRNGDAIPGVEMALGFVTDNTGCVDMSTYSGDLVDPSKDSPAADGVDMTDIIAIYDDILYINPFNDFYQSYAADINLSNGVTTLDRVLISKMILGLYQPAKVWTFFDIADDNHKQTINISESNPYNTFVGVKTGDVNDSYDLGNFTNPNPNETELTIGNDVLNNGQVYRTHIYNPISEKFTAINMSFKNTPSLKLKNVFAPYLPGFTFTDNVKIENGNIEINYIVSEEALKEGGILMNNSLPLITLVLEAKENGIMSEKLQLVEDNNNLIKTERYKEAAHIRLNWDKVIVNKVDPIIVLDKLNISPNPAHNMIYINELESQDFSYVIFDMQGRAVQSGITLSNTVEVSAINAGMYILKVQTKEGEILKTKFIKQ